MSNDIKVVAVGVPGPAGAGIGTHEASTTHTHIEHCTSGTHPSSPYVGEVIYETDNADYLKWNGSAWVSLFPGVVTGPESGDLICLVKKAGDGTLNQSAWGTLIFDTIIYDTLGIYSNSTGVFTLDPGRYRIDVNVAWDSSTNGRRRIGFENLNGDPHRFGTGYGIAVATSQSASGGIIVPGSAATEEKQHHVRVFQDGSGGPRTYGAKSIDGVTCETSCAVYYCGAAP